VLFFDEGPGRIVYDEVRVGSRADEVQGGLYRFDAAVNVIDQ
jgi:hypothetical protein